jgi:hypothetical protein
MIKAKNMMGSEFPGKQLKIDTLKGKKKKTKFLEPTNRLEGFQVGSPLQC